MKENASVNSFQNKQIEEVKTPQKKKKIINNRPLFFAFLFLLLAISTSKFVFEGSVKYIVFDIVLLLCFLGLCLWQKTYKTLIAVFCVFAFGLGWFFVGVASFDGKEYQNAVEIVGRVSDDIKVSSYGGSETILLKDVKIDGVKEKNISLTLSFVGDDNIEVGDIISFNAYVKNVSLFTLGRFNSSYFRDRSAYTASISAEEITVTGNKFSFAECVRINIKTQLYKWMGEENGAVAFATLFGDKNDLDGAVYSTYKNSGVVHLLTVSGLHVSFLIVLLGWILRKLKVKGWVNFLICALFLGVYAYFCNFSPSILRAGIMGLVLLFSKMCGKQHDILSSIGLAGILILSFSPLSALDMGFLMSFFCVISIVLIMPFLSKILEKVFPKKIANIIAVSVSTQIGILPFFSQMGFLVNFLSFFVNLIIVPIFSVLFPMLFVCVIFCLIAKFMGFLLVPCGWMFSLIHKILAIFGDTSLMAGVEIMNIFLVAAFYLLLFCVSKFVMCNRKVRICACASFVALCGAFYGFSYIKFPVESSINCCWNNSYQTVVLTNSKNQTVFVDFASEQFTKNLLDRLNISNANAAFVVQKASIVTGGATASKTGNFIRCDSGQGYEGEVLYALNEWGQIGDFSFVFRGFKNRLIGLEIVFDQTSVFIVKDWTTTSEAFESLPNHSFDFVILGKKTDYAQYFDKSCNFVTYYHSFISNASYYTNGNVSYRINGKNYVRRSLD